MSAEFTAIAFVALDQLRIVERLIERMSQSTNDPVMLDRLTTISDMVRHATGYVGFVASRAQTELTQKKDRREVAQ